MLAATPRLAALALVLGCVMPSPASAQYDTESEKSVWLRALLDLRVARGGEAPSWTDSGPGKTRFGGRFTDTGAERVTRFELAEFALEAGAILPGGWRAKAQLNVQHDIAGDYNPWI